MPAISSFYGIIIYMYFFDVEQHNKPHIHAIYSDQEAVLEIPSGEMLAGELKNNKLKLVEAWIEIHKEELMTNWELASKGHPIENIEPLK